MFDAIARRYLKPYTTAIIIIAVIGRTIIAILTL